jgi:IclR family pca regulon transcriptional regulator
MDLIQRGPRTVTSKTALLAELDHVRRTGVAVNDEELESALRSIAVPVRSRSGAVIAAVNIAIPWSPEAINELVGQHAPALRAAARHIAAQVI